MGDLDGAQMTACELTVPFEGVFTDSRAPLAKGLFVALRGERFDGTEFVTQTIRGRRTYWRVCTPLHLACRPGSAEPRTFGFRIGPSWRTL